MAFTELQKAFGEVLRETRLAAGMSQEALSFACGRHRTYVSLIERGQNSPSITTLWVLAEALGISSAKMIGLTEDRMAQEDAGKVLRPLRAARGTSGPGGGSVVVPEPGSGRKAKPKGKTRG